MGGIDPMTNKSFNEVFVRYEYVFINPDCEENENKAFYDYIKSKCGEREYFGDERKKWIECFDKGKIDGPKYDADCAKRRQEEREIILNKARKYYDRYNLLNLTPENI